MTQKELLYLEDAVEHEKSIITICEDTIKRLEDNNLISFLENEINEHKKNQENILNIIKEKANE